MTFGSIVLVKKDKGSATAWAATIFRDIALGTPVDRLDFLTIAFFIIGDEVFVSPLLFKVYDKR